MIFKCLTKFIWKYQIFCYTHTHTQRTAFRARNLQKIFFISKTTLSKISKEFWIFLSCTPIKVVQEFFSTNHSLILYAKHG